MQNKIGTWCQECQECWYDNYSNVVAREIEQFVQQNSGRLVKLIDQYVIRSSLNVNMAINGKQNPRSLIKGQTIMS